MLSPPPSAVVPPDAAAAPSSVTGVWRQCRVFLLGGGRDHPCRQCHTSVVFCCSSLSAAPSRSIPATSKAEHRLPGPITLCSVCCLWQPRCSCSWRLSCLVGSTFRGDGTRLGAHQNGLWHRLPSLCIHGVDHREAAVLNYSSHRPCSPVLGTQTIAAFTGAWTDGGVVLPVGFSHHRVGELAC